MGELRAISTRAEITPTRFSNEYQWGDLKADPAKLVAQYFDVHLYFANWGTHRLMVRLPLARVDAKALAPYFSGAAAEAKVVGEHLILDLHREGEGSDFYDEEKEGSLADLVPLRTELMRGDLRVAYLAWLHAVGTGDIRANAEEPPVPPGLSHLTAAQTAMVEFLRIDHDLILAAASRLDIMRPRASGDLLQNKPTDDRRVCRIDVQRRVLYPHFREAFRASERKPGSHTPTLDAIGRIAKNRFDERTAFHRSSRGRGCARGGRGSSSTAGDRMRRGQGADPDAPRSEGVPQAAPAIQIVGRGRSTYKSTFPSSFLALKRRHHL